MPNIGLVLSIMRYAFNGFELDPDKFELRRRGDLVALEPQVFALLKLLVEQREQMVSKDDIIDKIWDGRVVSDASIASRIRLARQAVDDDGTAQHTIRTIHGRGFRFVAPVTARGEGSVVTYQDPGPAPAGDTSWNTPDASPTKKTKPSIVVLPFQRLGGGSVDDVIAEAIPHELIQALSRLRWLFVIARGTAFRFRAPDPDVQQIGKMLGVRYCLTGTIENSQQTIAISVELSDTSDGGVVWSERVSSAIEGVHDIRAEIVARVVSSLETHIPLHEAQAAGLGVPENLNAWSNYHLALQHMFRFTKQDNAAATALFERAVSQDSGFARAYAGLSFTHFQDAFVKYNDAPDESALNARRFAERSLELDPLDPFANLTMGRYFWLEGALESSFDWLDRAITLSPNYAQCIYSRAFTDVLLGSTASARSHVDEALQLSPLDPLLYGMRGVRSLSFVTEGDYESAASWAEKAARSPGAHYLIAMLAVIAHSLDRNDRKASSWANVVRDRKPDACSAQFFESFPFTDPKSRERILSALKPYGL